MMLLTKRNNVESDIRTCARCYSEGNVHEMIKLNVSRGKEVSTLMFHEPCYDKYEYSKMAMKAGVSGVEYDADGKKRDIEKTLKEGTQFNAERKIRELKALLKEMDNPAEWLANFFKENK